MSNELKTLLDWLRAQGNVIQTVAIVVQTIVAAIMMVSLFYSRRAHRDTQRALQLGQKQFESTIEPEIEIRASRENPTLFTFANIGSVDVVDVKLVAVAVARFNGHWRLIHYMMRREDADQAKDLKVGESFERDFKIAVEMNNQRFENLYGTEPTPDIVGNLPSDFDPAELPQRSTCIVVRFRRTIDMRPYYKSYVFCTGNAGGRTMILSLSDRYHHGTREQLPRIMKIKELFNDIFKQADLYERE